MIEHKYHFRQKIKKVLYFYKESCKSIDRLKAHLSKEPGIEAVFSKKFPEGSFLEFCKPEQDSTILVVDDFFFDANTDEKIRKDLISCATIWTHHYGIWSHEWCITAVHECVQIRRNLFIFIFLFYLRPD